MTGHPIRVPALADLAGRMSGLGIDDAFIRELGRAIEPRTSALFVLVAKATTHKVVAEGISVVQPRQRRRPGQPQNRECSHDHR